jgi:hypothetical protein
MFLYFIIQNPYGFGCWDKKAKPSVEILGLQEGDVLHFPIGSFWNDSEKLFEYFKWAQPTSAMTARPSQFAHMRVAHHCGPGHCTLPTCPVPPVIVWSCRPTCLWPCPYKMSMRSQSCVPSRSIELLCSFVIFIEKPPRVMLHRYWLELCHEPPGRRPPLKPPTAFIFIHHQTLHCGRAASDPKSPGCHLLELRLSSSLLPDPSTASLRYSFGLPPSCSTGQRAPPWRSPSQWATPSSILQNRDRPALPPNCHGQPLLCSLFGPGKFGPYE